jgi:hypothetical protein
MIDLGSRKLPFNVMLFLCSLTNAELQSGKQSGAKIARCQLFERPTF